MIKFTRTPCFQLFYVKKKKKNPTKLLRQEQNLQITVFNESDIKNSTLNITLDSSNPLLYNHRITFVTVTTLLFPTIIVYIFTNHNVKILQIKNVL